MISYQTEAWRDVRGEIVPLWPLHYEEIALDKDKIVLAPDFKTYDRYAEEGALHIVTVRKSGEVVGYHFSIVRPHLHYRFSLSAFTDIYWLRPDCRKGMTGVELFRVVERSLKARGVEKMFSGTKLSLDMGKIFERLGWTEAERLYVKWIGPERADRMGD